MLFEVSTNAFLIGHIFEPILIVVRNAGNQRYPLHYDCIPTLVMLRALDCLEDLQLVAMTIGKEENEPYDQPK